MYLSFLYTTSVSVVINNTLIPQSSNVGLRVDRVLDCQQPTPSPEYCESTRRSGFVGRSRIWASTGLRILVCCPFVLRRGLDNWTGARARVALWSSTAQWRALHASSQSHRHAAPEDNFSAHLLNFQSPCDKRLDPSGAGPKRTVDIHRPLMLRPSR